MDFFEKLENAATDATQTVARKAKDIAEAARLKNLIHTCNEVMEQNYIAIGKAYYEAHKDDEENVYARECKAIQDAQTGAAALQEQLDAIGKIL